MAESELKCFDVCCGAGALSIGFRDAGAQILGGIDIDEAALATAANNHDGGDWDPIDIKNLAQSLTHRNGKAIWRANTILAGLPCQGFSAAGNRDPDDDRNFLYQPLLKIIEQIRPEHIVFENVLGITTQSNKHTLSALSRKLRRLDYDVAIRVLNAADFGVAQFRKRVFLVAVKGGRAEWVFECLRPYNETTCVREAFRGLPRKNESKKRSHVFMKHGPKVVRKLRSLKPGGPISYRRLEWEKCAPTLVAGHRALPVHPSEPRAISVREAARLQGFDDSYLFTGSNSSQIGQVANAVPPPLAKAIGRALQRYQDHGKRIRGPIYKRLHREDSSSLRRRFTRLFRSTYSEHVRRFPWRWTKQPYRILLTEILLQRTNAELAEKVWRDVVDLVPTPIVAANVDLRTLGSLTRKIGIRSRAKTIKQIGAALCNRHRGTVPDQFDELMRLPGVGIYIASAVRAICFDAQDFPIDSNGLRFVSRYFGVDIKGKKSEARQLREFMSEVMSPNNTREYVYGFLDFAATVCRPHNPQCDECPLRATCAQHNVK